ncbi:DUF4118 domain-containing protein [Nocardioides sp. KIGAM211]|uniref:histidine kinase n=1 Tax=Nocardioides luti TaxID=2761101 RepID=A0A7X0RGA8_9ACTN|nr:DUF4118 domain-containing protein [Nocardioides luti]
MTVLPDAGAGSLTRTRVYAGWSLAVVGTGLLTAVLVPLHQGAAPTFEAMLFLALAVACALVGGRWPALGASLLGTLSLNYFFTAPFHTLAVESGLNVLTLMLFAAVSASVASVVDSAARRRHQAGRARAEADTLAMLNRRVLGGEYAEPELLALARDTFGARAAELAPYDTAVPAGDTAVPAAARTLLVLRGVSLAPAERRVLAAFASHVGVLGQREELARQTAAARSLEAGNRTRTALLAAVSHDLRTPLAGIRAAAETLRHHDARLPAEERRELLTAIEESVGRLTTIVADLLDMSRLQTGAVVPLLTAAVPDDVVEAALAGVDADARRRVHVAGPLPAVVADVALLERVLANLLGNALRHSATAVEVTAATDAGRVRIDVVDHGPGVPPDQRAHIFEPFLRLGDQHRGEGVGLGLAVARGLVEAQGGTLHVEETPGGGLTAVVELAAAPAGPAGPAPAVDR